MMQTDTNNSTFNIDINYAFPVQKLKLITTTYEYDSNGNIIKKVEFKEYFDTPIISSFPSNDKTNIQPYNPLNPYITWCYNESLYNDNNTKVIN